MPSITPTTGRTSSLQSSQQSLSRLQNTQRELFRSEEQIATGRAITRPSDAPEKVATVQFLDRRLAEREQEERNTAAALNTLNTADTGLGEASDLLIEAKTIASSQVGVGSDADNPRRRVAGDRGAGGRVGGHRQRPVCRPVGVRRA